MAIRRSVRRDRKSALNGANGEYTGSDDVKNRAKGASLKVAKMAANMVLRNKAVKAGTGGASAAISKQVNRAIDKKMGKISGRGFYTGRGAYAGRGTYEPVITNQLVSGSNVRPAVVSSMGDETGEIVVSKREYLTDLFSTGSTAFYLEAFAVNPGLTGVFPFLSQVATNYTTYEFVQLLFEYVPVVSQSSTTGAMGTIILACNGNAASAPFSTKVEMNEYEGAITGRVCDHLVLGVECDPRKLGLSPTLYVRAGSVPSGQDIKTYDLGLYQIGLSGVSPVAFPAGTQLGEVWVHYKIRLRKPRLYDALGFNIPRDIYSHTGVGVSVTLPFGTAPSKSVNNQIGAVLSKAGNTTLTFPDNFVGYVEVYAQLTGAAVANVNKIFVPSGNITSINDLYFAGTFSDVVQSGSSTAILTSLYHCYVNTAAVPRGNYLTLSLQTYTSLTSGFMSVSQYNPLPGYVVTNGAFTSSMTPV